MKINFQTIFSAVLVLGIIVLSLQSCQKQAKGLQKTKVEEEESLSFSPLTSEQLKQLAQFELDSATQKTIEHFYQYFWEGNDLWGQFLVAQGSQIIYENYRGFSHYEDSVLMTPHTPIHLASISKNLTAMVVLKLIEKNKLRLHQPVSEILLKFPYPEITVFDLLTHRSGLGNYDVYAEQLGYIHEDSADFTNQRMYQMYSDCEPGLIFKPNTQHSYCNANYAFLALVIEEVVGKSFPQAMDEIVFKPLLMNDSYVFQKENQDTATVSYYYSRKPWKWDKFDYIYGDKNIYSTSHDLLRYSEAMFSDTFLRKSLLDSAMSGYSYEKKGIKNYGFGFRIREFDNGKKITFHTGRWHGNNTLFMHLVDEKITIIALGNRLSRANYASFSLSSLFGDYPLELEAEDELLTVEDEEDKELIDSLTFEKKEDFKKKRKKVHKDSLPVEIPKPIEKIKKPDSIEVLPIEINI